MTQQLYLRFRKDFSFGHRAAATMVSVTQTCCMYWGHLGPFHRAISHLDWYEMVEMGDFANTFRSYSRTCFHVFAIWGSQAFPLEIYCGFSNTELFSCLCISTMSPSSSGNVQKRGYLWCFHTVSVRIYWLYLIPSSTRYWGPETAQGICRV